MPALYNKAGLNCPTAVLVLQGDNYIRATFSGANSFKLKPSSGTDVITYAASADPGATVPITQGAQIDYMQNNLLTINWSRNLCSGLGALGACIGALDTGTATTKVTASLSNPDIVALDNNAVVFTLPTQVGAMIALDGDGTGSGAVFQVTQGGTASALALSYVSPSSTTEDVDFSSDNGTTWTYVPVAGDSGTQAAETNIRLRFKGSMAATSSLSVTVPYSVK